MYQDKLMINPEDKTASDMLDYLLDYEARRLEQENDTEWQKDNLEYDLRITDWILDKTRNDFVYAQNLYAALCNNEFQKNEVWNILTDNKWSCSWRYAGGILANMVGKGDYIDYYCSGIQLHDLTDEQFYQLDYEAKEYYIQSKRFVCEGVIVDEIREDLFKLGWKPVGDHNEI
jgi:hypothetical protein